MKTLYGDICISKQRSGDVIVKYPIKVEYYKTRNDISKMYGIEVVEKEYRTFKINSEAKLLPELTNNEEEVNRLLEILKENSVTPVTVGDIIEDIYKNTCKM